MAVLRGAIIAASLEAVDYNSPDRAALCRLFGIDTERYDNDRGKKVLAGIQVLNDRDIPKAVYALFGDSKTRAYAGSYKKVMPQSSRTSPRIAVRRPTSIRRLKLSVLRP